MPTAPTAPQPQQIPQPGYPPYQGQPWGTAPQAMPYPPSQYAQGKAEAKTSVPKVIVTCVLAAVVGIICLNIGRSLGSRPAQPVASPEHTSTSTGETGEDVTSNTSSQPAQSYVMTENLTPKMQETLAGIQEYKWEIEDQSGNWYAFAEDGTFTGHVGDADMSGRYLIWFGEDALRHMSQGMVDDLQVRYKDRPQFIDGHVFHITITVLDGPQPPMDEMSGTYEPMAPSNYMLNTIWLMDRDNIGTYTPINNLPGTIHIDEDGNWTVEEA